MLPNITRGHTFARLTDYLQKEKREAFGPIASYLTRPKEGKTERVGFVELVNFMPGEACNLEEAGRVMGLTAANAQQLKRSAGVAMTGQKATAAPVWHLSLSWTHGETPDQEEMIRTADSALRSVSLGFDKGYQTTIVQHVDTDHPHIHVVVNLVHPITGKQANPWKDRERLQVWGHKYDRSRGNTFCEYRAWKYEDRIKEKAKKPARQNGVRNRAELAATKAAKEFAWAMNEAVAIRSALAQKVQKISEINLAEYDARKEAKDDLWKEYEQKRADIKARYDVQIRDHYLHRKYKETRGRSPKGPTNLKQTPEWRGLNRRLRTQRDEFYKREMAPLKKGDRAWRFNRAANDNPVKEPAAVVARGAVEYGVGRRNKLTPIRMAMNTELAAASLAFKFRSQQLKVREAMEKLASRARWRDLAKERTETWREFQERHGLQEKARHAFKDAAHQPKQRGKSGVNHLAPAFEQASERKNTDELRWAEKTGEFRSNAEEITERFATMKAERSEHDPANSNDPPSSQESIRDRFKAIREDRAESQGWKMRGKDRARNRGRGGPGES
jgi:hypothetical protein